MLAPDLSRRARGERRYLINGTFHGDTTLGDCDRLKKVMKRGDKKSDE